jgi:alpha-D-ribose 1-methylphosphonate 5-triphosphate diphosphatase
MTELVLDNAMLVLIDRVVPGHVVCRGGTIAAVGRGVAGTPGAVDLDGDYLLPGLVELHTDNLERHVSPRPGVRWPIDAALLGHDAQVAAAGITTVCDALAVVDRSDSPIRGDILRDAISAVDRARALGLFRAEHFLHLRCEVSFAEVVEVTEPLMATPTVRLVSLMDHTPGQRQFGTVEQYRAYYQGRFGYSDAQMLALIDKRVADQQRYAAVNRRRLAEICRGRGLALASHDDGTEEHVDEAVSLGMTMAEFPTTREAARLAHAHGMGVIMGAPNMVRGGSHTGNVSARMLAEDAVLDMLSSDYVPSSLLHAAFLLHAQVGIALPGAVAMVSDTPARQLGLDDRGRIEEGRRADLVRVRLVEGMPVARQIWRTGEQVA